MYHTTFQTSPMKLVLGEDAILNVKHISSNWEDIQQGKQDPINKDNKCKNKARCTYNYFVGDKILVKA